ncbi:accessory gene regulator B family protein [Candidatus Stoquefichus massiliensis]|uniref:accessory gene regulator B family protein n=1 Tax=Candidatus Stoquefichus massiliensis TaxID=1470350 RepID=UPI0004B39934|nr:accessory gene regulator B family protein [Candidatus Stoquefichus massiliensis]
MKLIINYLFNKIGDNHYDKEVLLYGLEVLVYNIFTLFLLIIISLIFKNYYFGFFFIPVFSILRITIGGYHCKTIYGCTTLMAVIYSLTNILMQFNYYNLILKIISPFLIFVLLFIKPSVENRINFGQFDVYYKYLLQVLFILFYFVLFNSTAFSPVFSALLIVEIMYQLYLITHKL